MFSTIAKVITLSLCIVTACAAAGQLEQVTNFGVNPTNVKMHIYRPAGLVAKPSLVVALHNCSASAQVLFNGTQYANLADQYKNYMLIYPTAPDASGCWDVHTKETLAHDAGGDSQGVASMIKYALANYGVDATRVYITGAAMGAVMSQVMVGSYPDLIRGIAAFSGTPFGCFAGTEVWNSQCAQGKVSKTAPQWGDVVRKGYTGTPGYPPKVQIWHGAADTIINYKNFQETIKQWTNVYSYNTTPLQVQNNFPLTGWTRSTYGAFFQASSAEGVGHDLPSLEIQALSGFTIIMEHYAQCGGTGYTGSTICAPPFNCSIINGYYSQCL